MKKLATVLAGGVILTAAAVAPAAAAQPVGGSAAQAAPTAVQACVAAATKTYGLAWKVSLMRCNGDTWISELRGVYGGGTQAYLRSGKGTITALRTAPGSGTVLYSGTVGAYGGPWKACANLGGTEFCTIATY
jgi:hypothetical protein